MKQFHLHHLFQELSAKLTCPQCKKKIRVQDLELANFAGNQCTFEAKCLECGNLIAVNAVVESQSITSIEPASSEEEIIDVTPVSNDDIDTVKRMLYAQKSFKDIFKP